MKARIIAALYGYAASYTVALPDRLAHSLEGRYSSIDKMTVVRLEGLGTMGKTPFNQFLSKIKNHTYPNWIAQRLVPKYYSPNGIDTSLHRYLLQKRELLGRIISEVKPYTMVPAESLAATISITLHTIETGVAGDIVECGTWKGGASFAMLLAQRYVFGEIVKPVWMLDSFQGLPPANPKLDGRRAVEYQHDTASPTYYDNCSASLAEIRDVASKFDFALSELCVGFNRTLRREWFVGL